MSSGKILAVAARWCVAALLTVAVLSPRAAEAPTTAAAASPAPVELAAGVYCVPGARGVPDRVNLGRTGNAGFIVGRTGVLVIDTGASYLHGKALLAALREVTDQPVRLAIVTNPRKEFVFGASAFREQGIPVAMHQAAATSMAARFDGDLAALRSAAGEDAVRGTLAFRPDIVFSDPLALNAAALIGRPIQLLSFGPSGGSGDIAVYDPRSRTLFAGALLDAQRIPDLADGDPAERREALTSLEALPIEEIVPGHGPSGGPRVIAQAERYLDGLAARVRAVVDAGAAPGEIGASIALPEFASWDQYDTLHPRNATLLAEHYRRERLAAPAPAPGPAPALAPASTR